MNKKTLLSVIFVLCILTLAGCFAGPNSANDIADTSGDVAGFWLGFWHGFILPVTFILSLFSNDVHIYEVNNNGGLYTFGFILGVLLDIISDIIINKNE